VELEQRYAAANALNVPIALDGSVAALPSRNPANWVTSRRISTTNVDFAANRQISPVNDPIAPT
jgi:hypothetical protein